MQDHEVIRYLIERLIETEKESQALKARVDELEAKLREAMVLDPKVLLAAL